MCRLFMRKPAISLRRAPPKRLSLGQEQNWQHQNRKRQTRRQDMQVPDAHAVQPGRDRKEHDDREDVPDEDDTDNGVADDLYVLSVC